MKNKKIGTKLALNKKTISNLAVDSMGNLKGGATHTAEWVTCAVNCTNWTCESNVWEWCTWDWRVCNDESLGGCTDIDK